jgi:terminase large subunit-like protein
MVSTPNAPDGLFERIEKEPEEICIYKRILLDYTYGLGRIYNTEEIEKAKQSPSFEREYDLQYLGLVGNVFHTKDIEAAIEKGAKYDPELAALADDPFAASYGRAMGIDPAYGSSSFGIVITQLADKSQVQVLYADEFQRPDFNEMLNVTVNLINSYNIKRVYIDAANPSFIRSLKLAIGEREDYENQISYCKKMKWNWHNRMTVIPVSFNVEHKEMLGHVKMILEKGLLAINPTFSKLTTALRTAVAEENSLDKEATSHDDILDAYQLALKNYAFGEE